MPICRDLKPSDGLEPSTPPYHGALGREARPSTGRRGHESPADQRDIEPGACPRVDQGGRACVPLVFPPPYDDVSRPKEVFAMAERKPAKRVTQRSAKRTTATGKTSKGFTAEERAAMKERAQELKAEARRGPRADKADGESAVLAKIAEMR